MVVLEDNCFICGGCSSFEIAAGATCFREARCHRCGARLRNSDLAKILMKVVGRPAPALADCLAELGDMAILEAQAAGPVHQVLAALPGYIGFEYMDGVTAGSRVAGILSNDLHQLTFPDAAFDLVITQDVLEHVADPAKACAEINRVLRPNGYHIFTVPLHEGRPTVFRSGLPEVYHGDPLRKSGALVNTDWGSDIGAFMGRFGMKTHWEVGHRFYEPQAITDVDRSYAQYLSTERIKYFRYNSVVLIAQKVRAEIQG